MKKNKVSTLAATSLCLTGCAGPQITALDVQIAQAQAEAQRACYAAQALPETADARDVALLAMARALSGDPCRQTNVYDARAAIAASQNQAVGRVVPGVVSGAVAATGIVAGASVLKTGFRQAGNVTNTNIRGEGNSVITSYDTVLRSPVSGPDLSSTTTTTTTTATGGEATHEQSE